VKCVEESTRIKSISLSGNTVTEVVNETADDLRDQFRSNNKVFQAYSMAVNESTGVDTRTLSAYEYSENSLLYLKSYYK